MKQKIILGLANRLLENKTPPLEVFKFLREHRFECSNLNRVDFLTFLFEQLQTANLDRSINIPQLMAWCLTGNLNSNYWIELFSRLNKTKKFCKELLNKAWGNPQILLAIYEAKSGFDVKTRLDAVYRIMRDFPQLGGELREVDDCVAAYSSQANTDFDFLGTVLDLYKKRLLESASEEKKEEKKSGQDVKTATSQHKEKTSDKKEVNLEDDNKFCVTM